MKKVYTAEHNTLFLWPLNVYKKIYMKKENVQLTLRQLESMNCLALYDSD